MAMDQGSAKPTLSPALPMATIFAFDDVSIPYQKNLYLTMCPARKHEGNPVLRYGIPGDPDEFAAKFYDSIIYQDGRYRMWYPAADREITRYSEWQRLRGARSATKGYFGWRLAYAESEDGIHWTVMSVSIIIRFGRSLRSDCQTIVA